MANISQYLETALLNAVLRNLSFTSPSGIYVGLYTTLPANTGLGGTEVSGGSYARQLIAFDAPTSSAGTSTCLNSNLVQYPIATASWGTVIGLGLFDAPTGGNLLYFGAVASAKTVGAGDQVTFPIGSISVGES